MISLFRNYFRIQSVIHKGIYCYISNYVSSDLLLKINENTYISQQDWEKSIITFHRQPPSYEMIFTYIEKNKLNESWNSFLKFVIYENNPRSLNLILSKLGKLDDNNFVKKILEYLKNKYDKEKLLSIENYELLLIKTNGIKFIDKSKLDNPKYCEYLLTIDALDDYEMIEHCLDIVLLNMLFIPNEFFERKLSDRILEILLKCMRKHRGLIFANEKNFELFLKKCNVDAELNTVTKSKCSNCGDKLIYLNDIIQNSSELFDVLYEYNKETKSKLNAAVCLNTMEKMKLIMRNRNFDAVCDLANLAPKPAYTSYLKKLIDKFKWKRILFVSRNFNNHKIAFYNIEKYFKHRKIYLEHLLTDIYDDDDMVILLVALGQNCKLITMDHYWQYLLIFQNSNHRVQFRTWLSQNQIMSIDDNNTPTQLFYNEKRNIYHIPLCCSKEAKYVTWFCIKVK